MTDCRNPEHYPQPDCEGEYDAQLHAPGRLVAGPQGVEMVSATPCGPSAAPASPLHPYAALPKPYYEQDGITIYHGDCREVLRDLAFDSRLRADLIVTDPPFFLPAQITQSRKLWPRTLANVAIMDGYFRETFQTLAANVLRPSGAFYVFADSTSYAVFASILYPLFDRTQCIVWDKGVGGLGVGWRHSHELIAHGAWRGSRFDPAFRRDVITCPVVPPDDRDHSSEKPVALLRELIGAHPDGTVLDPFMGSGTTLRAAKDLGRKAIGIEIEERYCEIAAKRMAQGVLL